MTCLADTAGGFGSLLQSFAFVDHDKSAPVCSLLSLELRHHSSVEVRNDMSGRRSKFRRYLLPRIESDLMLCKSDTKMYLIKNNLIEFRIISHVFRQ